MNDFGKKPPSDPFGYTSRAGGAAEPFPRLGPGPSALAGFGSEHPSLPATRGPGGFDPQLRAIAYANLMSGAFIVTEPARVLNGADINTTNKYVLLYENSRGRPVALKVTADFAALLGAVVNISFTAELSNQNLLDQLSSNGRVISDPILLKDRQKIYLNTAQPQVDLTTATFRALVFDPVMVFGEGILP